VLVIGIGNSALDISLEASSGPTSRANKPVRVSAREGATVLPVSDASDRPIDRLMSSRFYNYSLPKTLVGAWLAMHTGRTNATFQAAGLQATDPTSAQTHFSNVKQHSRYCKALADGDLVFAPGVARVEGM
jgi:hypothetical protein